MNDVLESVMFILAYSTVVKIRMAKRQEFGFHNFFNKIMLYYSLG